ncbi:MAG: hypothetical protein U0790_28695 [Isosphaeraceae bacterium]
MEDIKERHHAVLSGIWLIGLGILFATRAWWPGIMLLIAATAVLEGYYNDQLWYGLQTGYWCGFIGVWAVFRYNLVFLLVGLGLSSILGALVKPSPFAKPKPFVDGSLE